MEVTEVHRIVKFKQKPWIKPCASENSRKATKKRLFRRVLWILHRLNSWEKNGKSKKENSNQTC